MKKVKPKAKIITLLVVSFVVFAMTFFAMAENKNNNSLFLDSDQDGLTDQEELMIGTDPRNTDTDGDGYSDGKEVESGYNPLKAAPGDKIMPSVSAAEASSQSPASTGFTNPNAPGQAGSDSLYSDEVMTDLTSDPNNPNLTNEMIEQLLEVTKNKAGASDSFANNPTYTADDLNQITQNALRTIDITKDLPDIKDDELNILPPVDDKKLSDDEVKTEQKTQIEHYLAQIAFLLASNSPFPVDDPNNLESQINSESSIFLAALTTGDTTKIDSYAAKAQTGIDQLKKVEVPYVLKDIHKSTLQLAVYTLGLKDNLFLNMDDPMKSLAAVSSLHSVAQSATKIQSEMSQILTDYGIDAIKFP